MAEDQEQTNQSQEQTNQSFDRDNDVISSDEFQKLEQQEQKKNPIKRLFKKGESQQQKQEDNNQQSQQQQGQGQAAPTQLSQDQLINEFYSLNSKFDQMLVSLEKQNGRIDMEQDARKSLGERLVNLSSQVGELRSVIVSKERFFNKMEAENQKIKDQIAAVNPEKIESRFQEVEKRFVKNEATIEKVSSRLLQTSKQVEELNSRLSKLGTYDHLFEMLEKINSQVKNFEEMKNRMEKIAAKVESYFSELNDKMAVVDDINSRIKANESSIKNLSHTTEKMNAKLSKVAYNDDLEKLKKEMEVAKKDVFKNDLQSLKDVLGDSAQETATNSQGSSESTGGEGGPNETPNAEQAQATATDKQDSGSGGGTDEVRIEERYKPLLEYVKKAKSKGISEEMLIRKATQAGWPEDKVKEILASV